MNRSSILSISAMMTLGLALLPTSSIAQQTSLKEQLVGTWTLTSYEIAPLNGAKRQIANPKGILMFDAGGRYSWFIVRGNRPKYKSASDPTTEEIAATIRDYVAGNFGTWSVNEADKTLTRRYDAALNPNNDGSETKVTVSLSGDELKLTSMTPAASGNRTDSVYRRAK
jgi:hypothetical protein